MGLTWLKLAMIDVYFKSKVMYGFLGLNFERSLFFNCISQLVHSWHAGSLQGTLSSCKVLFALQLRIRS